MHGYNTIHPRVVFLIMCLLMIPAPYQALCTMVYFALGIWNALVLTHKACQFQSKQLLGDLHFHFDVFFFIAAFCVVRSYIIQLKDCAENAQCNMRLLHNRVRSFYNFDGG